MPLAPEASRVPLSPVKIIKPVVFILSLVPAAWLTYGLFYGDLGANPAEAIQLKTGIWTFRFLIFTLLITPVRRWTGENRVIQFRRMLGLFAFFYGSLHFLSYFAFDLGFVWSELPTEIARRPFITAGMVSFLAMLPLAITSTRGAIRRLGRRWQVLHRLIYLSAIAAAVHYVWKVKVVIGSPVYYAAIVAILLAVRVVWALQRRRGAAPADRRIVKTGKN